MGSIAADSGQPPYNQQGHGQFHSVRQQIRDYAFDQCSAEADCVRSSHVDDYKPQGSEKIAECHPQDHGNHENKGASAETTGDQSDGQDSKDKADKVSTGRS